MALVEERLIRRSSNDIEKIVHSFCPASDLSNAGADTYAPDFNKWTTGPLQPEHFRGVQFFNIPASFVQAVKAPSNYVWFKIRFTCSRSFDLLSNYSINAFMMVLYTTKVLLEMLKCEWCSDVRRNEAELCHLIFLFCCASNFPFLNCNLPLQAHCFSRLLKLVVWMEQTADWNVYFAMTLSMGSRLIIVSVYPINWGKSKSNESVFVNTNDPVLLYSGTPLFGHSLSNFAWFCDKDCVDIDRLWLTENRHHKDRFSYQNTSLFNADIMNIHVLWWDNA